MKRHETALVLAKIASVDNRRLDGASDPDTPITDAWHEVVGDFGLQDCLNAVTTHRKQSTEWIQPAHIVAIVKDIRAGRLEGVDHGDITEDVDPNDTAAYLATLRYRRKAIADGLTVAQANALPLPDEAAHALVDRRVRPVILARRP